jgi:hypothetical protein
VTFQSLSCRLRKAMLLSMADVFGFVDNLLF